MFSPGSLSFKLVALTLYNRPTAFDDDETQTIIKVVKKRAKMISSHVGDAEEARVLAMAFGLFDPSMTVKERLGVL